MDEFSDSEEDDNLFSLEDIRGMVGMKEATVITSRKQPRASTPMLDNGNEDAVEISFDTLAEVENLVILDHRRGKNDADGPDYQPESPASPAAIIQMMEDDSASLESLGILDHHRGKNDADGPDYQSDYQPEAPASPAAIIQMMEDDSASVESLGILDPRLENEDADGPDYQPISESSSEESDVVDVEDPGAAVVKRRKRGAPQEWKRIKNRKLRMKGKEYLGFSRPHNKIAKHDKDRPARLLKPTCTSKLCSKSKVRFCSGFSEAAREEIFQTFWNDMNWDQRKVFVAAHVEVLPTKRKSIEVSRRKGSLRYSLHLGDVKHNVCKIMFLNTLSLGEWSVANWAQQSNHGMCQSTEVNVSLRNEGNLGRSNRKTTAREFAISFLDSLPKLPSHYCRKNTTSLYLEPGVFYFKSDVYSLYKSRCVEENTGALSQFTFAALLEEKNIKVFSPKKDQCDTCCQHETGNLSDADWNDHIKSKDRARSEKDADKTKALENKCHVFTMDLMAVKLAPCLKASALYYKTKLCVHIFTLFNLATRHVTNFIWHEGEGELVASSFASCVVNYLTEHCVGEKKVPIIIYSDGCTYQNRNAVMSSALLHFAAKHDIEIQQKYLVKGHTQMECDSVHAAIEKKLKNRDIHLPSDYVAVSNEARSLSNGKGRYETKYLDFKFFVDYAQKNTIAYDSIRPGRTVGDPVVTDIRAIVYHPYGTIQVKLDFDNQYEDLPRRPKKVLSNHFPGLNATKIKIPARKFEHLQQLKAVLPHFCHSFYDELPKE